MKGGNKLFIFTGIALALVTVLLAITMTSGGNEAPAKDDAKPGKVKIVKAAVDFEPHKVVSMSDIVVEEMASDQVPDGAVNDTRLILGQSYKLGAVKGDILLASYVEAPGITDSIEAGKRAFSLEMDNREMFAGLIMDGDYVDVIFDARVDLQRVLEIQGIEVSEDGPYHISFKTDSTGDSSSDGGDSSQNDNGGEIIPGTESASFQGKPDSEFIAQDFGGQLEPVTKILVQNVKVIRVVKPGVTYDGQGQQVDTATDAAAANQMATGQLILEVTPQQAEALSFMQQQPEDQFKYHDVEVVVRGKDDHDVVNTTGISFEILMTDKDWKLPYPKPVPVPAE